MSTRTMPMARCAGKTACTPGPRSHCKVKAVAAAAARDSICLEGSKKKKDYYKVLSLERPADVGAEEIKRAYRRLALQCHPDVCPPSRRAQSTELFLELRRAYETLSDPAERVRYDAELELRARSGEDDGDEVARPGGGVDFPRDVWEAQLCGLRARSEQRQRARSGAGVR